jgi:hypothetical protein
MSPSADCGLIDDDRGRPKSGCGVITIKITLPTIQEQCPSAKFVVQSRMHSIASNKSLNIKCQILNLMELICVEQNNFNELHSSCQPFSSIQVYHGYH